MDIYFITDDIAAENYKDSTDVDLWDDADVYYDREMDCAS